MRRGGKSLLNIKSAREPIRQLIAFSNHARTHAKGENGANGDQQGAEF